MIKNLLNLFFPKVCSGCTNILSDHEEYLCTKCRHDLPVTNYHFNNDKSVEKIFYGRAKIINATALLRFEKKSIVQHLLHNLKYKGQEDIGLFLGKWLGHELALVEAYKSIDIVIPVPLHKKKLRKRGYNQTAKFGIEIAKVLNAKYVDNVLVKTTNTKTQVFKNRLARWTSDNEIFGIKNHALIESKHVLLVDDIITTGATIESCANILNKVNNVKISVACMAIAQ
ncbi:MAG: phosphoribosyltransferase family protein [Flavobacteriaceae bacterium]